MANPSFFREHNDTLEQLFACIEPGMKGRVPKNPESYSDWESVFREILNRFDVTRRHDQREVWDWDCKEKSDE